VLLGSPLGRVDPVAIRALGRGLLLASRGAESRSASALDAEALDAGRDPASSDALLTAALVGGSLPTGLKAAPEVRAAFDRVAGALAAVREAIARAGMVSEVLWAGWVATDWPDRLREAALRGGSAASSANRDLDALLSLFDLANRLPAQRRGRVGVESFLEEVRSLRIPQEARAQSEVDRDAVRLISAHRAKGLEWELVVVASVQEGEWPDLRLRSDLLHVHELDRRGRVEPRTHREVLAEERRLMYVACTRARSELVVTAVAEPYEGGAQPSRFLDDLGVEPVRSTARAASPLAGSGLVAALRAAASAPEVRLADGSLDPQAEALRGAAVARLAALAGLAGSGRLGGPHGVLALAHPDRWWGVLPVTVPDSMQVLREGSDPAVTGSADFVRLSPSAVESLRRCPLQWFLERRVGAGTPSGSAAAMGVVVHAVAEALARGEVAPDRAQIAPFVDEIWAHMPFAARYQSRHERARVDEMIEALLSWQLSGEREVAAAEVSFALTLPGAEGPVSIAGKIDRIDRDAEGRAHLVDFKTGKNAASAQATAENPQLGIYQLAVRDGAVQGSDAVVSGGNAPGGGDDGAGAVGTGAAHGALGGAELVFLADRFANGMPKVRAQAPLPEGWTWVHDVVLDAARLAGGPEYPARRNGRCTSCAFRYMCPAQGPVAAAVAGSSTPPAPEPPARAGGRGGAR
jgi:RecB family exonuclease